MEVAEVVAREGMVEVGVVEGGVEVGVEIIETRGVLVVLAGAFQMGKVEDSFEGVENISATVEGALKSVEVGVEVGMGGSMADVIGSNKKNGSGAVLIVESDEDGWGEVAGEDGVMTGSATTGEDCTDTTGAGTTALCGGGGESHPPMAIMGAARMAPTFPRKLPKKFM